MPPEPNAPDPRAETSKPALPPSPVPTPPPAPAPAPVKPPVPPPPPQTGRDPAIAKILLPKKEAPGTTVQSAQRVNAGILLEQETTAGQSGFTPEPAAAQKPPVDPATPEKKEEVFVRPLETYQGDIERLVQDKNVSMLSIAAAEAGRRGQASAEASNEPAKPKTDWVALARKWGMTAGGVLLLVLAVSALAYIFLRPTTVPIPAALQSPFISVDTTKVIPVTSDQNRGDVMNNLETAKMGTALSLGLIARLLPAISSTTPSGNVTLPLNAQAFLPFISPDIPANLLRTIAPDFLLGVHVYNDNQPLLIMHVDSYEQAYSGMLAWEPYMQNELAPLFTYTPAQHIPEQGFVASTTGDQFIQTGFVDKIVENHDTRVIVNGSGDVVLLWTFLDLNTLVITTNDATLREIISRLKEAPVTPIPTGGQ